eukprot:202658-Amphidinium_carterae.1
MRAESRKSMSSAAAAAKVFLMSHDDQSLNCKAVGNLRLGPSPQSATGAKATATLLPQQNRDGIVDDSGMIVFSRRGSSFTLGGSATASASLTSTEQQYLDSPSKLEKDPGSSKY